MVVGLGRDGVGGAEERRSEGALGMKGGGLRVGLLEGFRVAELHDRS